MELKEFLEKATTLGAADIFIVAGLPLTCKVNGKMIHVDEHRMMPEDTERMVREIYSLVPEHSLTDIQQKGDDDFSFALPNMARFRASIYKQRGSLAAVIRLIAFQLPNPGDLEIPQAILNLADYKKGLVLVTGPAGSGKSTSLACLIDRINSTRESHIITLEDPLEFLHRHKLSIVSQREVSSDTKSYQAALRAALRQAPDVILLGEMRDYETINIAMTAAETGHLVFSTLHTIGAANAVDRIIDVFPANQQRQITVQLASVLNAVVSQQLVQRAEGGLIPAFELMTTNNAIRNMIRDGKVHQIDGMLYSSMSDTLFSMDSYLGMLYNKRKITRETALNSAVNPDMLKKRIK
ncbi:MAG: PilT/PilU family type 4a pilus ATPase [Eubacteriales bacterium]|nr:PilT/PilU family type 4a pilus ATPase [Eubacteriales bacterium]